MRFLLDANMPRAVLVTRDLDFADVRSYPPQGTPGLLVLRVPDDWASTRIASVLEQFLSMESLVASLPDHLAILDQRQVRFRPALGPTALA